ncbi:MAG: class I SAM-dependent methyltransferase [bacterium]|nr:class I SAM-dependent methyltransferase [bacterium]MDT8367457.1 class I SAM-dependent methyltransferase [bacterium]
MDPDLASIDKARHLLENGVKLVVGSGESIPLPDNSVDTVVFSLSLHHHPNPEKALIQARRVLKEGGRILVLEPGLESTINRCFRVIHDEDDACERASEALKSCGARLEGHGSFISTWQFDFHSSCFIKTPAVKSSLFCI